MKACPLCGFIDDGYTHYKGCVMLDLPESEQTAILAAPLDFWYRQEGYVWMVSDDLNGGWVSRETLNDPMTGERSKHIPADMTPQTLAAYLQI